MILTTPQLGGGDHAIIHHLSFLVGQTGSGVRLEADEQTGLGCLLSETNRQATVSFLAIFFQDFLPADIQTQFAMSRELIRNVYNSFYKLRDRAERIASRAIDNAADLLIFGKELRQVTL